MVAKMLKNDCKKMRTKINLFYFTSRLGIIANFVCVTNFPHKFLAFRESKQCIKGNLSIIEIKN